MKSYSPAKWTYASLLFLWMAVLSPPGIVASSSGESDEPESELTPEAIEVANYAFETYREAMLETLGTLVTFETVAQPGVPNAGNPQVIAMSAWLKDKCEELGFDFEDHGAVVVIALGDADERLGVVTHGDVQPADPAKWASNPFSMDRESEPGRIIGRGVEDDKGPIAVALYAMKAIKDRNIPLGRRIELIISYTEESDWEPFMKFLQQNPPPDLNIVLDGAYPVITAEKGWCLVSLELDKGTADAESKLPYLASFTGGVFVSQVPEDATAVITNADSCLVADLKEAAAKDPSPPVAYSFELEAGTLTVRAKGVSAHSSVPEEGVNAITHLAAVLGSVEYQRSGANLLVDFTNNLVGNGYYAGLFGKTAYSHDFMGPMTLALTMATEEENRVKLSINLRRPAGKAGDQLKMEMEEAVGNWQKENSIGNELKLDIYVGQPHYLKNAPHVSTLLKVFEHYTGTQNPQPQSMGGGTHARLLPNGVVFGPAFPGEPYTGHSEHEYLTEEQLNLNLKMVTAVLVSLCSE